MKKRFNLWLEEKEISELKKNAKQQRRSVNGFVLYYALESRRKKEKRKK